MNDLSYKWIIDGQLYSTTKDLDWLCEIETSRVSGVYEIHRNSAGNSQIYSFSIELDEPYLAGFSLLVEEQGQLRYDFISYTSGQPYNYTYNKNAAHDLFPFTGNNPRLKEYWSCEASNIIGEEMFLDDDPANCFSFDGHTLAPTLKLSQEFINDELPAGLRVKDFMHGGFVSYLLADDGRVFQRRGTRIYYTGRFMDLPMQYKGKQIKGVKLIGPRYAEQYGLIYDESEGSGRLLLVNFDYSTAEKYTPTRQGIISEFPDNSNLSNITDYELIDGWYVRNSNSMASGTDQRVEYRHAVPQEIRRPILYPRSKGHLCDSDFSRDCRHRSLRRGVPPTARIRSRQQDLCDPHRRPGSFLHAARRIYLLHLRIGCTQSIGKTPYVEECPGRIPHIRQRGRIHRP